MNRTAIFSAAAAFAIVWAGHLSAQAEETPSQTLVVRFDQSLGPVKPRVGFLGGLRDSLPDDLIQPLKPSLWRIGHQFRGRIAGDLTGAVERVERLGATYKLVMSDLIDSHPKDWAKYEADVQKLVAKVKPHAGTIIWEPVNEPDISHKPIEQYFELYAHAFKALREVQPDAVICGPGFAFPSYEKYRPFLDYCREHRLECNYLAWHYTGWDPHYPEQARWKLGRLRELIAEYPDQKIREIHCDEWGAGPDKPGPDKPGRLQAGRAVVWFHYLENVYNVDRACRANWGREDDYLGGLVNADGRPFPVYHVYRLYAATAGQTRVATEGNNRTIACLASREEGRLEVLLGSVAQGSRKVVLELQGLGTQSLQPEVRFISNVNLDEPLAASDIPVLKKYSCERQASTLRITLDEVAENQAYHVVLRPAER